MDDNYPDDGRRGFVKKVVGGSVLASVAATGVMSVDLLTQKSGVGGGNITTVAIELLDGPAPRGMPQIPVEITDSGELVGRAPEPSEGELDPTIEIGGYEYSMGWFQYCGVQGYPGTQPQFESDNKFRFDEQRWHEDMAGDVMTTDDFSDWESYQGSADGATEGLGKPAWGTWRSEGVDQTMPIQVMKTDKQKLLDNADNDKLATWIEEAAPEGYIAWLNKCTHFCCVPQGFQTSSYGCGGSGYCSSDLVYCQCHQSQYDPFSSVEESMVALPRPEPSEVL